LLGGNVEESKDEKRQKAFSLFIESVIKPDHELRTDAHDQKCYNELMEIRDEILDYLKNRKK
jgi:hypothetical protein